MAAQQLLSAKADSDAVDLEWWKKFAEAGVFEAFTFGPSGIESARSRAFELKADDYPAIDKMEVLSDRGSANQFKFTEQWTVDNPASLISIASSSNYDAAILTKMGVNLDLLNQAHAKEISAKTEASRIVKHDEEFPKVKVKLDENHLQLTKACQEQLEVVRSSPNKQSAWANFHKKFGVFITPVMVYGGAIRMRRSVQVVSEQEFREAEDAFKISAAANVRLGKYITSMKLEGNADYETQKQGSSAGSLRSSVEDASWVRIGGHQVLSSHEQWLKELEEPAHWRIIRRSSPVMLYELIMTMPETAWIKEYIAAPDLVASVPRGFTADIFPPRFDASTRFTIEHTNDLTILLFQDSFHRLCMGTLGRFDHLANTTILDTGVAIGTPLAMWHNLCRGTASALSIIFANTGLVLQDMIFDFNNSGWTEGNLVDQSVQIHQRSSLVALTNDSLKHCTLIYQDPDGFICRLYYDEKGWKSLRPNQEFKAKPGTPLCGYPTTTMSSSDSGDAAIFYLSPSGTLQKLNFPGSNMNADTAVLSTLESPPAAFDFPRQSEEILVMPLTDFAFALEKSGAQQAMVYRTGDHALHLCWKQRLNTGKWQHERKIAYSLPGSYYSGQHLFDGVIGQTLNILFVSPQKELKIAQIGGTRYDKEIRVSQRTVFGESTQARSWQELLRWDDQFCSCCWCG